MTAPHSLTRRTFVQTLTSAGLGALVGRRQSGTAYASESGAPQTSQHDRRALIDVHHHFLPPDYVRIVGRAAIARPAPSGAPVWDVARSLDMMDQNGIAAAVVSITTPGIWLGDAATSRRLARITNHFGAQMVADHPGRFGLFATLPLPDATGSLAELRYATDDLKCDGIALMTNYGDRYLGDRGFDPVLEAINRRGLIVYVHPFICSCDLGVLPGIPAAMIEFPHSTTRALVGLLLSDCFARYPDIRWIFSHAGGTVPFLVNRIVSEGVAIGRKSWDEPLRRCYYDTASSTNAAAFGPLLELAGSEHVLFGTDFPFVGAAGVSASIAGLHALGLSQADLLHIEGANARSLFPRLVAARDGAAR